jgi:predicted RNase H-like nuclease (RuvC/YqgF family)
VLNLLRKKPSKQKNTVEIDVELEREISTLKESINNIKKNTELTYKKIDEVKKIRDELKIQYNLNYKYPICLKNGEIDLPEIDLFEIDD